jgi:hypothetical protein
VVEGAIVDDREVVKKSEVDEHFPLKKVIELGCEIPEFGLLL